MKENRTEEGYKAKIDYIKQWNKENKKTFSASLEKKEADEITEFLKSINMNKSKFIRQAYEELKKKHK